MLKGAPTAYNNINEYSIFHKTNFHKSFFYKVNKNPFFQIGAFTTQSCKLYHRTIKRILQLKQNMFLLKGLYSYQYNRTLVGWLFGLNGISTFVDYLMPNPFYTNNQFYFKQFSLAWVHSLIVKSISTSSDSVYSNNSNPTNSV